MIEVWLLTLPLAPGHSEVFRSCLDGEEQSRLGSFQNGPAAERFLAGRGLARHALSSIQGSDPAEIRFSVSAEGKPFVESSPIAFNLAHTGSLVCVACGKVARLGIDAEHLKRSIQTNSIVKRYFTPGECVRWSAMSIENRPMAFFRIWTRKEAFLKGTGEGIAGLSRVEVSALPDEPRALLSYDGDVAVSKNWWFAECEPDPDYLVSVAVEGPVSGIRWHRFL